MGGEVRDRERQAGRHSGRSRNRVCSREKCATALT